MTLPEQETRAKPTRGLALLTRGEDGKNLLVGAMGSDVDSLVSRCLAHVVLRRGSTNPEDWMAWTLDCSPSPGLLRDIEQRVASGQGGLSHPAVTGALFSAGHPNLRTP